MGGGQKLEAVLQPPSFCEIIDMKSQLITMFGADMATLHNAIAYAPNGFGSDTHVRFLNLSFEQALAVLPENVRNDYATTYQWFIENTGTIGTTTRGKRIPGTSKEFCTSALRGIHKPKNQQFALSISSTTSSKYTSDTQLSVLPDGTWLFYYSEHSNNKGDKETDQRWNDSLINCMNWGLPVGVFLQQRSGADQYYRALAFVEDYNPITRLFTLHGPVLSLSESVLSKESKDQGRLFDISTQPTPEELMKDTRRAVTATRKIRDGQRKFRNAVLSAYQGCCAVTGCSTTEALQAAHILECRGIEANIVSNGLLLRADIHLLYDSALLSIDPDTNQVVTGALLKNTEYSELKGKRIRDTVEESQRPNPDYLKVMLDKYLQLDRMASRS